MIGFGEISVTRQKNRHILEEMELNATQQAEFVSQIAKHQAALHAYIISLMPGMDGVDDVLQETNMVLWENNMLDPTQQENNTMPGSTSLWKLPISPRVNMTKLMISRFIFVKK